MRLRPCNGTGGAGSAVRCRRSLQRPNDRSCHSATTSCMRTIAALLGHPRLLLASLTLLAFANTLGNGFVWIDHWQVESGGLVARSWPELLTAFQQPLGSMPGWEGSAPYA